MIKNGLKELLFTSDGIKQLKAHHYPHVRGGMAFVFICLWFFLCEWRLKTLAVLRMLFFNCLGCCNKTREFVFADINMFWARLRLNFAWAARRGLKWALRRTQNIVYEREYKLHYYHFRGHKTEKVSFRLSLGKPSSMIRAIAQIDADIYGAAFYPLISYCILSISSATRPCLCPFYHFEIHFTVPNSLC